VNARKLIDEVLGNLVVEIDESRNGKMLKDEFW